jgi:hypothetical protein
MKLIQAVVLAFFASCAMATAPIVDFPAACGTAPSEGFYHAEMIVSENGQRAKVVDYYAAIPKQCWKDVADFADDAVKDWRTVPVIVVSGAFSLREIQALMLRIKTRFISLGEVWQVEAAKGGEQRYTVYVFVPRVSRDRFAKSILPIIAPL